MSALDEVLRSFSLRDANRFDEALDVLRRAVAAYPGSLEAQHNLGLLLFQLGRLEEAEAEIGKALKIEPERAEVRYALGIIRLANRRYRDGWPLYQARFGVAEFNIRLPTGFPFPHWEGEALAGKRIVVFPEQGYGDQIQFARFLPLLQARGAEVVLLARPALERLFRDSFPGVLVVAASGAASFPDPDFWTMSSDLALYLDATVETLPAAPYLVASAKPQDERFRIGLKLTGNPHFRNDAFRTLPEEFAARLRAHLPGELIDLEPAASGAQDFAETGAIVAGLDHVVSVDTSVAHLAGALGTSTAVLLSGFATDWRWMRNRDDSPWYPSARLFRTGVDSDWGAAVDAVIIDALVRYGLWLHARQQWAETEAVWRRIIALQPNHIAVRFNLASLLTKMGRHAEAEPWFRDVLAAVPDSREVKAALSLPLLAMGRYEEGLPLYAARVGSGSLKQPLVQEFGYPRWQGEAPDGRRIVIFPEQGLGDQIAFARFLPGLAERAADLTVLIRPELERLFRHSFPSLRILAASGAVEFPDPDFWITAGDLPLMMRATVGTIPAAPYIDTPIRWPDAPAGFKVGLKTRGNPQFAHDRFRSLSTEQGEALRRRLPGQVVSLEPEDSGARDFAETAAIIRELDLVVSSDTSITHLAGAMGKRAFLLVPAINADWRWGGEGETTPWYPHHRLFRASLDGWDAALDRLVSATEAECAAALP
jgi:ADP-heptose:LPS heptosyltransferase/Tfp pilus assembly protein PilF